MNKMGRLAIGAAIAVAPLYVSALTVTVDGKDYDVNPGNIIFEEGGLTITTNGGSGGDSGSGGGSDVDSGSGGGGSDGDSSSGGGSDGDSSSGGGGNSGGGDGKVPDGAVPKGSYPLVSPPGEAQRFNLRSDDIHVFKLKNNVSGNERAWGDMSNSLDLSDDLRRMWFSTTPAGDPIDNGICGKTGAESFVLKWTIGAQARGYCQFQRGQDYYLNVERASGSRLIDYALTFSGRSY